MSTAIDLPVTRADFPQRCVSCGAPPDTTIPVECTSGVDLVFISLWRWHEFALPCCSFCKSRRRSAGLFFGVLGLVAVFGVMFGMFALEQFFTGWGQRGLWLWLTIGSVLATVYFVRNWTSPLLDAWFLGVRGVRLSREGIGTLRFRELSFAVETADLSRQIDGTTPPPTGANGT